MTAVMTKPVEILYKDTADNLMFLKRQQWAITNYALIVYAAVYALRRDANWIILTIVTVLAWGYAAYSVWHTQTTLKDCRDRLQHIYKRYFTKEERDALNLDTDPRSFFDMFLIGLLAANSLAAAVAIYLVWRGR